MENESPKEKSKEENSINDKLEKDKEDNAKHDEQANLDKDSIKDEQRPQKKEVNEEDKEDSKDKEKKSDEEFLKTMREVLGFKTKPKMPKFEINKKAQKKYLKEKVFSYVERKSNSLSKDKKEDEKKTEEEDKKMFTNTITYPSGIIKTVTKNGNNVVIEENINYNGIKENYVNNLKNNLDQELKKLIENSFLVFNRKQLIRKIVKNPLSTKALEGRILLWKYYIKGLSIEEKAHLIRKFLFYIGKFSDAVFDEFLKIKEISLAYLLIKLKKNIDNKKDKYGGYLAANNFYMFTSHFGYDLDGNPKKEEYTESGEEMHTLMLLSQNSLNIKQELNGTGYGLVFLKELKEIFDMYHNVSIIFESILYECNDIFINNTPPQTYRIMWNFFSDYFIDNPFVINFLTQLKFIYAFYKQDEVVKYIHDLVLVRWNTYQVLDRLKGNLENLIGKEEIIDQEEKIENMKNIDDLMKYIEGDEKPKKKKKKKKKNNNKINMLDELANKYKEANNQSDDEFEFDDNEDGMSIITESDSVLNCFKKDIMAETEFNTGNKIAPTLSTSFINSFKK